MTPQGRLGALIAVLALVGFIYTTPSNPNDISDIKVIIEDEPLPAPVVVKAEDFLVKIDQKEFDCMRTNIYFESRNQRTDAAYIATGYSVVNRVGTKGYPDTLCGVIKEKRFVRKKQRWVCQYSWFCDGKSDEPPLYVKHKGKMVPNTIERKAWERAGEIALKVMLKEVDNPIKNATMYHATYVSPNWDFKKLTKVIQIEDHIYYSTKV